ncbi:MAG: Nif3-like dinuclear metal center hexameric protein [Victivallaceae bacterium]
MINAVTVGELADFLDNLLNIKAFSADVSNNGLQVEGSAKVKKVALAVDASMATFEAAKADDCDFILVHHGLSWGSEPRRFAGDVGRRLQYLFKNNLNLYAVHLPLDANPTFGHNVFLADLLKLEEREMFFNYDQVDIGVIGNLRHPLSTDEIAALFHAAVTPEVKLFGSNNTQCRRVGCISGGAGLSGLLANSTTPCIMWRWKIMFPWLRWGIMPVNAAECRRWVKLLNRVFVCR